jgi:NTP pyrophosphatase (non-canonical NTP hydrolase)
MTDLYLLHSEGDGPLSLHWTREDAEDTAREVGVDDPIIEDFLMPPLWGLLEPYFRHRNYVMPDLESAFDFFTAEVGEMADAKATMKRADWVRNHPENKHANMASEGGDALMMLIVTLQLLGADPLEELARTMKEKGYDA